MKILKLHGSLNWVKCCGCNKVVAWPNPEMFRNKWLLQEDEDQVSFPLTSITKEFQHCATTAVEGPQIVPPTWNKAQYHGELETVWRAAANVLSDAENIFVIGYSLPETDQFFRYLYALGTVGPARLKRFWVIDPDDRVESRFRELLGQAVESRFQFINETFESGFHKLRSACNLLQIKPRIKLG